MPLVFVLFNGFSYHESREIVQRDLADNGANFIKILWVKVRGIQRMQRYGTKHIAY